MDYLPIFLDLKQQACLVVGAGAVAARKIKVLCRVGASVTVVGIDVSDQVLALAKEYPLTILQKPYADSDMLDMLLVVCATNQAELNAQVAAAANRQKCLVNVVDNPALCSFIFPAIVDRSPVIAAISSGGVSPVLSRLLRSKIESLIPSAYGTLAQLAEKYRTPVKTTIVEADKRRMFWENVLQGPIAELVFAGRTQDAELALQQKLQQEPEQTSCGEVYLVGAGPGDPDLLTLRALRFIQQADVIVYDRLVSQEILDLTRRDADKIYVGKQRNQHSLPQESINELLANLAIAGKRVVRLKGGDPFIFGRGGEEIETLMQHGIRFQVVPGITAASGCASYAGIPLTHRDHAQACLFVTGHLKDNSVDLNWQQMAAPHQTVVIYMGLMGLKYICDKLIEHGCPQQHPIAIIQQGTTQEQKVLIGTLSDMPQQIEGIKAPTLIIIGTVVKLHSQLNWFKPQAETLSQH